QLAKDRGIGHDARLDADFTSVPALLDRDARLMRAVGKVHAGRVRDRLACALRPFGDEIPHVAPPGADERGPGARATPRRAAGQTRELTLDVEPLEHLDQTSHEHDTLSTLILAD